MSTFVSPELPDEDQPNGSLLVPRNIVSSPEELPPDGGPPQTHAIASLTG